MKLEFKPMNNPGVSGIQAKHDFENGYGVSVIQNTISYGASEGLYELAVTKGGELCYDTEITDDVIGYLTLEEAEALADRVAALDKPGE